MDVNWNIGKRKNKIKDDEINEEFNGRYKVTKTTR